MVKSKKRIISILAVICVFLGVIGCTTFALADTTAEENVVVNGFNSLVTRGDSQVGAGAIDGGNNFAKYTMLESGDVITYHGKFSSGSMDNLARTVPYRFSIKAKGEGSVTWKIFEKHADGSTAINFSGTYKIGGKAFDSSVNYTITNNKVFAAGEEVSIAVDGHHIFGSKVFYMNSDGTPTEAGSTKGHSDGGYTYDSTPEENEKKEFDLSFTVSGDIQDVQVKAGQGLFFVGVASGTVTGFEDDFKLKNFDKLYGYLQNANVKGIYAASSFAFKGYDAGVKEFVYDGNGNPYPYVAIGDMRVANNGNYTSINPYGAYIATIPLNATVGDLRVKAADAKVTFQDGENTLNVLGVLNGQTVSQPDLRKKGFEVDGWYTSADFAQKFNFETTVTADLSLFAKWKTVKYVEYISGSDVYAYENFETELRATAPKTAPTKQGFAFIGWYTDNNFITEFDFTQVLTENTSVYAGFGFYANFRIFRADGVDQIVSLTVADGKKIDESRLPSAGDVLGYELGNTVTVEWYTDNTLSTLFDFKNTVISAETNLVGVLCDTRLALEPNEFGWDTQQGYINDGEDNILTSENYGSMVKMQLKDGGYTYMRLNYVGYISGARALDVTKDIYFDCELDSACDGPWTDEDKFIMFTLFSNANVQLSAHDGWDGTYGGLGTFGVNLRTGGTELLTWPDNTDYAEAIPNSYSYNDMKATLSNLVIRIGETSEGSGIWAIGAGGAETKIVNLNIDRSMFAGGKAYINISTFRITDVTVRITQESGIVKGADNYGTFTFDKQTALAGESVQITATPNAGYTFTVNSVFADGVNIEAFEKDGKYYFYMPFGNGVEITLKYQVVVTFMADGASIGTADVIMGSKLASRKIPTATKTGYNFVGWFYDEAFTKPYVNTENEILDTTTVYAKFEVTKQTVTFVSDGKTLSTSDVDYGSKATAPSAPTKDKHEFGGWFTDEACTTAYNFDSAVNAEITLYAKWTKKSGCGSDIGGYTMIALGAMLALALVVVISRQRKKN